MATIAVFLVLSGGTAVALNGSNTVFSDDIVNNQVYSADVRNDGLAGGGLAATDLRAGAVGTSEVLNDSLTHGDIANAASGSDDVSADLFDGFDSRFYVRGYSSSQSSNVTGRSSLHSNRVVLVPGDPAKELFDLNGVFPNLGDLTARCFNDHADILWRNSTGRTIDLWQEVFGAVHPRLMPRKGFHSWRIPITSPAQRLPSESATTPAAAVSPSCTGSPSRARTARRAGSRPRQWCGRANSPAKPVRTSSRRAA
jgi:hypothetical protein